jgi:hypothetical protein
MTKIFTAYLQACMHYIVCMYIDTVDACIINVSKGPIHLVKVSRTALAFHSVLLERFFSRR